MKIIPRKLLLVESARVSRQATLNSLPMGRRPGPKETNYETDQIATPRDQIPRNELVQIVQIEANSRRSRRGDGLLSAILRRKLGGETLLSDARAFA